MKDELEHRAEEAATRHPRGVSSYLRLPQPVVPVLPVYCPRGWCRYVPKVAADKGAQIPTATNDVTPFKIHVPQAALNDVKKRLANARWPDKETVTDWSQGVPLAKAHALVEYWHTHYDWRRVESALNRLPQFRSQLTSRDSLHSRPIEATRMPCQAY